MNKSTTDNDRKIDSIIIHCADTPEDNPSTSKIEGEFTAADVESWHKQRALTEPWSHYTDSNGVERYIGYHYVVRRDGGVESARPENVVGCHCKGMNATSLAVCWIGRNHLTEKQRESLISIVAWICVKHALSYQDIYGHAQFSQKTCPNFSSADTFESIDAFRERVDLAIRQIK